jgi:hypothetical protein
MLAEEEEDSSPVENGWMESKLESLRDLPP